MTSRTAIAAAALLLALFGLAGYLRHGGESTATTAAASRPAPASTAPGHSWASTRTFGNVPLDPANTLPLSVRVDRLAASGNPEDAFEAYWLVQSCIAFGQQGSLLYSDPGNPPLGLRGMTPDERRDETALCAGMTERIRTTRLEHLERAARAGVMGADVAFAEQGPFGDPSALRTRLEDPLVQAWKRQALAQLAAQAEQGAMGTIMWLQDQYLAGSPLIDRDPARGYTMMVAQYDIQQAIIERSSERGGGGPNPYEGMLAPLEQGLSPQQRDQAQADGAAMAANTVKHWNAYQASH